MSNRITKKVSCPHCGAEISTEMWSSISAEVNPDLREKVLHETLFDWRCPECGYEAQLIYPCLYHDKMNRFLVYVAPGCEDANQHTNAAEEFPQFSGLKKRVVLTPAALKEKILIFESGMDDRAIELVKLALANVVAKKNSKETTAGYFCFADEVENRVAFSFFLRGEEHPIRQGTRLEVYQKSLEIVNDVRTDPNEPFCMVDAGEAQHILDCYKGG